MATPRSIATHLVGASPLVAATAFLVLTGVGRTGAAQAVELRWDAPDACPRQAEVAGQIERLIEHPEAPTAAEVVIRRVGRERYRASVRLGDARRELNGRSCDALARAVVVVIAVAIDPTAIERADSLDAETPEEAPEETPEPATPEAAPVEPTPEEGAPAPAAEAPPAERERPRSDLVAPLAAERGRDLSSPYGGRPSDVAMLLGAGLGIQYGTVPDVAFAFMLGIGARVWNVELFFSAGWFSETARRVGDPSGAGGAFLAAAFRLDIGYRLAIGPLAFVPRVAVDSTIVVGRGFGVDRNTSAALPTLGLGGGLDVRLEIVDGLELVLAATVVGQLARPAFDLVVWSRPRQVYQPDDVALRALVGLVFALR